MPDRRLRTRVMAVTALLTILAVLVTIQLPGELLAAAPGAMPQTAAHPGRSASPQPPQRPTKPAPVIDVPVVAGGTVRASHAALTDIPSEYLAYYVHADQDLQHDCPALSWQLLAGIGKVESDHGRSPAPGVRFGVNRFGCCAGPMQFNVMNGPPSTWDGVKRPGDSVYEPADAIPGAGRKLCRDGLGGSAYAKRWGGKPGADPCPQVRGSAAQHRALRRYDNACWYAQQVLILADRYTSDDPNPATVGGNDPFLKALVANPRIATTASHGCDPKPDLASGRLDLRALALLAALAEQWTIRISCIRAGHSYFVKGTRRVSNHTVWRAVDIDMVNGARVTAGNRAAHDLVAWLDRLDGPLRPAEIGSPFVEYAPKPAFFTDEGHQEHVHIGYGPESGIFQQTRDSGR